MIPPDLAPPFLPLRRDPHFGRARRRAAGILSVAQAAWFLTFLEGVRNGMHLTPAVCFLGILGLITITTKAELVGELALAVVDAQAGLPTAPPGAEVLRRGLLGVALQFALLWLAYALADNPVAMGLTVAAMGAAQMAFWALGYSRWRKHEIAPAVLKALLTDQPDRALEALKASPPTDQKQLNASALAIAGVAIRKNRPALIEELEEVLPTQTAGTEEILAVLRADRKRLIAPEEAAVDEARALRLIGPGHPRRLALVLFVTTAALEQGDGESAMKALRLLHTREVPAGASRLLVNWLLWQAARMAGDDAQAAGALDYIRRFPRRLMASIQFPDLKPDSPDPYAIWMKKAEAGLGELAVGNIRSTG